jgi:hypothetical protein
LRSGEPRAPSGRNLKTPVNKPAFDASTPKNELDAAPTIPGDPQGLLELRRLAAQAEVSEADLCRHYNVEALGELSPRDTAKARRALARKVEAACGEAG